MVNALRELFATSRQPGHDDKESCAEVLAHLLTEARTLGTAHAAATVQERGHAWGRIPHEQKQEDQKEEDETAALLAAAWAIVTNFVSRIAGWLSGQEDVTEADIMSEIDGLAETVATTEIPAAVEDAVFNQLQAQDFMQVQWYAQPGACNLCTANAAQGPISIGSAFASGDTIPPAHPRCRCSLGAASV